MTHHHLALRGDFGYSDPARKTARAGFSSLYSQRRTIRHQSMVAFSCPRATASFGRQWRGHFGALVSFDASLLTPPFAAHHRLAAVWAVQPSKEPAMAALPIFAHSAHTFPLTEKSARRAARQWFTGTPTVTLATWRDDCRKAHCAGLPADPARIEAFNAAFASELAAIITGVNHG